MQKPKSPGKNEGITYKLFSRTLSDGRLFYIRFYDAEGSLFLTRATGSAVELEAHQRAAVILALEDLSTLALQKKQEREKKTLSQEQQDEAIRKSLQTEAERLADMPLVDTLRLFWDPEKSPYLLDLKDAGRPLSNSYITDNTKNIERYFTKFQPFKNMPIKEITFGMIDDFLRKLRHQGKSRYIINSVINTLRAPCTWLSARGSMSPVSFRGITLPEKKAKERGLLTMTEIEKILELHTAPIWYSEQNRAHIDIKPRSRLPGKQKNEGNPSIGFREKFFVILAAYTGARLGELRALRWRDVDIKSGIINIEWNYVDKDGLKEPKARSKRKVVISTILEPLLLEAKKITQELGADGPDFFVLVNPADYSKPISSTIIARGWDRILRAIGISEAEQKKRNLVVHGLRHLYATRLVDAGMSFAEAGKLTGHRVVATLGRYSDHVQDSTMKQAKKILDKKLHGGK